jgi:transcription initiation factor TFIIIB Brf1 subunit/transcription initiation factor TFIIB
LSIEEFRAWRGVKKAISQLQIRKEKAMYADFSSYCTDFDPCTRCSGTDVVSDTSAGDIVCRNCGEIQVSRVIDSSAEWRDYDEDDRNSRGSAARSSCTVDRFGSTSTYFAGGLSNDARDKLAKTQIEATDKRELKMMKTAEIIDDIGAKLNLTRRILVSSLCSIQVICLN